MGVVYRSTHPRLEIPVAIKVLAEQYSSDASFRQRFHREAATVAALNHPGIVRVYDFDEDGPVLFIVMEWVEGRSMRSWLDEYGRFSVDVSVDLVQQLLSAVGVAHDYGIVNRDLKPDKDPRLRNLQAHRRQAPADRHRQHGWHAGLYGARAGQGRAGGRELRHLIAGQ